jgi:hypothetical protein
MPELQQVQSFDPLWLKRDIAGLLLDLFGFIQTINPALEVLLNRSAGEVKGLGFQQLLSVSIREYEALWAHIQRGLAWEGQLTLHNHQRVEAKILPDIPEKSTLPLQFLVVFAPTTAPKAPVSELGIAEAPSIEVSFLRSALRQQERINEELTKRLVFAEAVQQGDRLSATDVQPAVVVPLDTDFEQSLFEQLCTLRMRLARVEQELAVRTEAPASQLLERQRSQIHEVIAVLEAQRIQSLTEAQTEYDRLLAQREQELAHKQVKEMEDRDRYHEELVTRLRLQFNTDLQAEREKWGAELENLRQQTSAERPAPQGLESWRVFFQYLSDKLTESEERSLFSRRIKAFIDHTDSLPHFDPDVLQAFKKAFIQLMVKRG